MYRILDNDFICQIGFVHKEHPIVIPTIYGRSGDELDIWAGLVPIKRNYGLAIPDPLLKEGINLPESVLNIQNEKI